jgi:hypothetical protein
MSAWGSRVEYFRSIYEEGYGIEEYTEGPIHLKVRRGVLSHRGTLKITKQSFLHVIDAVEGAELLCGVNGEVGKRSSVYDVINTIPVRSGDFFKIPEGMPVGVNARVKKAVVIKSNPIPMIFSYGNDDLNASPSLLVAGALSVRSIPILKEGDCCVDPVLIHGGMSQIEDGDVIVRYIDGYSVQIHNVSFAEKTKDRLCVKKRSTVISVAALSGDVAVEAGGKILVCAEGNNVQVPAHLRKTFISSASNSPVMALITTPARTSAVGTISTSVLR